MKPLVSIIVPTFNEERFVGNCLTSITNQDYENYELIVADSYSKDRTVEIARKYTKKVVLTPKKGPAAGRNAGARAARGGVLVFVDADTMLLPNTVSELARPFRRKSVVGVACPLLPLSHKIGDMLVYWFFNQFVKSSIELGKPQVGGTCCAYRRKAFEEVGGFNESLRHLEDLEFSRRISQLGKVVYTEKTLALTSARRLRSWGMFKVTRRVLLSYLKYLMTGEPIKEYPPVRGRVNFLF
jgi:glycosyltransferase involved in cell wall biosynthesis